MKSFSLFLRFFITLVFLAYFEILLPVAISMEYFVQRFSTFLASKSFQGGWGRVFDVLVVTVMIVLVAGIIRKAISVIQKKEIPALKSNESVSLIQITFCILALKWYGMEAYWWAGIATLVSVCFVSFELTIVRRIDKSDANDSLLSEEQRIAMHGS